VCGLFAGAKGGWKMGGTTRCGSTASRVRANFAWATRCQASATPVDRGGLRNVVWTMLTKEFTSAPHGHRAARFLALEAAVFMPTHVIELAVAIAGVLAFSRTSRSVAHVGSGWVSRSLGSACSLLTSGPTATPPRRAIHRRDHFSLSVSGESEGMLCSSRRRSILDPRAVACVVITFQFARAPPRRTRDEHRLVTRRDAMVHRLAAGWSGCGFCTYLYWTVPDAVRVEAAVLRRCHDVHVIRFYCRSV